MSRRSRPHYHSGLEWILGVAFEDTLTRPARLAQGFTHVRCCGSPRASSPHGLAAPALASRDGRDCVQLPPARGCYHLAPRRTFTSNPLPMPGTRRVGAKDYSSAPLTEPDVRATHPALWIDISEVQRELNRNLRAVKPRRRRDRSFSRASLFATESFAARMRPSAQPFRPPKGCRRTRSSIAGVPSFSIHLLLGSAGFRQPPRYYEEIRLLRGRRPVVVASFGSTARGGPTQTSLGNDTGCPAAPAPTTTPASDGFWASRSKTR